MSFSALKRFFSPPAFRDEAHAVYLAVVEQSRRPRFYQEMGVPDTLDGRFDLLVLHLFLLIQRVKHEAPDFVRALSELFIADMDRSLREMGVGDTGISHRVKKMIQAFYGRLQAYEHAIQEPHAFKTALEKNIYRSDQPVAQSAALAEYCLRNQAHLAREETALLLRGRGLFLD